MIIIMMIIYNNDHNHDDDHMTITKLTVTKRMMTIKKRETHSERKNHQSPI